MKKIIAFALCGALIFSGCSSLKKSQSGALIGGGSGALVGAALGYLITGDAKGAAIGATAGTAVGATTGAVIGNKMDKKAAELAKLNEGKVETFEINGVKAIRVTFGEDAMQFATGKADLSAQAKTYLEHFAATMKDMEDTDITVWGHTDNTGSASINQSLSLKRASAVDKFLQSQGIAKGRITAEGKSFDLPVASNDTAEGRKQNRRVEVFVTANEAMIKAAEAGTLK